MNCYQENCKTSSAVSENSTRAYKLNWTAWKTGERLCTAVRVMSKNHTTGGYTHTNVHTQMHNICKCMYTCMCVCTCVSAYIYIYMYPCVVCMHVCMCTLIVIMQGCTTVINNPVKLFDQKNFLIHSNTCQPRYLSHQ